MQDRPDAIILLEAIQDFLMKDVMQLAKEDDFASYKTLVSWNMLGVVSREIKLGGKYLDQEVQRLSAFLKKSLSEQNLTYLEKQQYCSNLNKELSSFIKENKVDNSNSEVWNMVKQSIQEKVEISNPRFSK